MAKTELQQELEKEVNRVRGSYYPVYVGLLRRVLTRHAALKKLHPNPADEFCFPEIGPNYEIVAGYEKNYRSARGSISELRFINPAAAEPLQVQKTKPDGYMILNGHHRWVGAKRAGMKRLPIRIVNLTQLKNILKFIDKSDSDKRVTLDLDEVVLNPEDGVEKPLMFPLNRIYRERLRSGIPALFFTLNRYGYDIWVYTANYYSLDYLRRLFLFYRVKVTGIITGTTRKTAEGDPDKEKAQQLIENKYRTTLHIDNGTVLRILRDEKKYEEYPLKKTESGWSGEVIRIIGEIERHE